MPATDMVILDCRPMPRIQQHVDPGRRSTAPAPSWSIACKDFAPRPETLVVVNCAGRTRSIIGAQSLINAGLPNKVIALKNGTMGWHLAGLKWRAAETTRCRRPRPEGGAVRASRRRRRRARSASGGSTDARLARLDGETAATRSTVSTCAARGICARPPHGLPLGAGRPARAGDRPVCRPATPGSCCYDNDGVRAVMTASWLMQMGWPKIYVLAGGIAGRPLAHGSETAPVPELDRAAVATITAAELHELLDRGECWWPMSRAASNTRPAISPARGSRYGRASRRACRKCRKGGFWR